MGMQDVQTKKIVCPWYDKTRVTSYEFRVESLKARVASLKARVEIQKCEFELDPRLTSSNLRVQESLKTQWKLK